MLFERFEATGLAHYSYLIGDADRAVVVDPRPDCDVYVEAATRAGLPITHILETHRIRKKWNLDGVPLLGSLRSPRPLSARAFAERAKDAVVLDTRSDLAFTAAHVPGSIFVWQEGLAGWAGWFLPYDKPILLVTETHDVSPIVCALLRIGYDRVEGFLSGSMWSWHTAGLPSESTNAVTVQELCGLLDAAETCGFLTSAVRKRSSTIQSLAHITSTLATCPSACRRYREMVPFTYSAEVDSVLRWQPAY